MATEIIASLAGVERIDLIAERILRRSAPFRFRVACSQAEIDSAQQLRYQTARGQGWAVSGELPFGMERDGYDDGALHVIALYDATMVATARIVLPTPGRKLPIEGAFGVSVPASAVELGRLCKVQGCPDPNHGLLLGLIAQAWIEIRTRGFSECCGAAGRTMIRLWQIMGFPVVRLAPARYYWGEERWPILVRPCQARQLFDEAVNHLGHTKGDME